MSGDIDLPALKLRHAELWSACLRRAQQSAADYDDGGADQIIPRAELEFTLRLSADREAQWVLLEQAWLSGQMPVDELMKHRSDDPEFDRWFEGRVEHRLKVTSPSQYDQFIKKRFETCK